jgi:hypothetical protein
VPRCLATDKARFRVMREIGDDRSSLRGIRPVMNKLIVTTFDRVAPCRNRDGLLLVRPALDPALQMDLDFLKSPSASHHCCRQPSIDCVPFREWEPPYDWRSGTRPVEISIREANNHRATLLHAKHLAIGGLAERSELLSLGTGGRSSVPATPPQPNAIGLPRFLLGRE